jgi:hypothetical protein
MTAHWQWQGGEIVTHEVIVYQTKAPEQDKMIFTPKRLQTMTRNGGAKDHKRETRSEDGYPRQNSSIHSTNSMGYALESQEAG